MDQEAEGSSASLVDQAKITDILTKLTLAPRRPSGSSTGTSTEVTDGLTRVEVWHPTTAQKSYGAERRSAR